MASAEEQQSALVPGRSCGTCVVCCYIPQIHTLELKKDPGVVCSHCTGSGCGIYEARPPVCRNFFCGWRCTAELDDDWRPDKSGIFILPRSDGISEGSPFSWSWQFTVFGGEEAIRRRGLAEMMFSLIQRGGRVFLAASGPMGMPCALTAVNATLADVVLKGDLATAQATLLAIYRELVDRVATGWTGELEVTLAPTEKQGKDGS